MQMDYSEMHLFPWVSGVATSIPNFKNKSEKQGHAVFIFTTTDKDVNRYGRLSVFKCSLSLPLRSSFLLTVDL